MNAKEFVDTNILLYAVDPSAGDKLAAAQRLLNRLWAAGSGALSLQVMQGFYVNATRKLGMDAAVAAGHIKRFQAWKVHCPGINDFQEAVDFHQAAGISLWDAMIVRSAQQLQCSILWSEDLNPGQRYLGVVVRNPFLPAHRPRAKSRRQPK